MNVKEEIKSQIMGALKDTGFPIETPEELLAAFPKGFGSFKSNGS